MCACKAGRVCVCVCACVLVRVCVHAHKAGCVLTHEACMVCNTCDRRVFMLHVSVCVCVCVLCVCVFAAAQSRDSRD
jgi:hypothetical protein